MATVVDKGSYELHVLHAAGDGVEPAIIVRAPERKAEYLFNVPEGFSRLALEHKLIPSARLSCVCLTSLQPKSVGGLGGLLFRLKQDGHGHVQMVGPRGVSGVALSLRHIMQWTHPKVTVSECCDDSPLPVFEDEHIVIVPLLAGDSFTGCPWCLYACDPKMPDSQAVDGKDDDVSDCSGSTTTSDDSDVSRLVQSASNRGQEDSFEKILSTFRPDSPECKDEVSQELDSVDRGRSHFRNGDNGESPRIDCCYRGNSCGSKEESRSFAQKKDREAAGGVQNPWDREEPFHESCHGVDQAGKPSPSKCVNKVSVNYESEFSAFRNKPLHDSEEKGNGNSSLCVGDLSTSVPGLTPSVSPNDIEAQAALRVSISERNPGVVPDAALTKGFVQVPRIAPEDCGISGISSNSHPLSVGSGDRLKDLAKSAPDLPIVAKDVPGNTIIPYDWRICNSRVDFSQPAEHFNPVYGQVPSGQTYLISSPQIASVYRLNNAGEQDSCKSKPILGYICFLRKVNAAFIIVDCGSLTCLESLMRHPALSCIHQSQSGVSNADDEIINQKMGKAHFISAVVHLTPRSLLQSGDYQSWMRSFPSPAHIILKQEFPDYGFQSSLSTLKTLNIIHREIFPLPPDLRSSPRTSEQFQVLNRNSLKIVDAELCMGLHCSEKSITLSNECVHVSSSPSLEHRSSQIDGSCQSPQFLAGNIGEKNSFMGGPTLLTSNAVAAAGIKRELLEERMSSPLDRHGRIPPQHESPSSEAQDNLSDVKDFNRPSDESKMKVRQMDSAEVTANTSLRSSNYSDFLPRTERTNAGEEPVSLLDCASEFQLFFLGTGCAEPSKKRGSSGILLQVRGARGAMLLDAGEGTAGQLSRRFGEKGAIAIMSSLQCLWLSHKHADHVLGVISILHSRSTSAAPLIIIGPHKVGMWLEEMRDVCEATETPLPPFTFVHCGDLSYSEKHWSNRRYAKQLSQFLDAVHLQSIKCVKVIHCYDAYGIVIDGKQGWRVVYSGDTEPCQQLIEAGRGSTVLIHEATYEDSMFEFARQRRHSTVSDAVRVGVEMQARHIILTHFSQRYPEMVAISGDLVGNLSLAFDGMVVSNVLLDVLDKLLVPIRMALQKLETVPETVCPNSDLQHRAHESPPRHLQHSNFVETSVTCLSNSDKKGTIPCHKRWLLDSDDEANENHFEGLPVVVNQSVASITWSSDSDVCLAETRQLDQPIEVNSSSPAAELVSKVPECVPKVVADSNPKQEKRPFSDISESSGPFGRKHIRWNDSDSEDG